MSNSMFAVGGLLLMLAFIVCAGCTSEAPDTGHPRPIESPASVVEQTRMIPYESPTVEPTEIATPEPVKVDPIVGHFIRVNENVQFRVGTEIIVLDDNSIYINIGPSTERRSQYTINPAFQAAGTIKKVGEGKYFATVTITGEPASNPETFEIRLIPEQKDPDCDARIIPEHIETIGLRQNEDASNQEGVPTSFKFPVRVNY